MHWNWLEVMMTTNSKVPFNLFVNGPYNVYYVVFLNLLFIKIKYYYHYHYCYLLMKHSPKLRRIRFMLPSGKAKVKIQKYKWYSFIAEKTERWPWTKLQNAKQDSLHYLRLKKDSKLWIYVFFFYRCLSGCVPKYLF